MGRAPGEGGEEKRERRTETPTHTAAQSRHFCTENMCVIAGDQDREREREKRERDRERDAHTHAHTAQ